MNERSRKNFQIQQKENKLWQVDDVFRKQFHKSFFSQIYTVPSAVPLGLGCGGYEVWVKPSPGPFKGVQTDLARLGCLKVM